MNDHENDYENEGQGEDNSLGLLVQRDDHGLMNVMSLRAPGRGSRVTRG